MTGKLMTMGQAIGRFVPDGSSLLMGAALESMIPFAAGHELIRQRRRRLTLVGPISDALFDQLIGAGCVARVVAAWVGNVSAGLAHNYRRAVEQGLPHPLDVVEHSNFTLALGLLAGSLGAPYIPTRTLLGSDLLEDARAFDRSVDPDSGGPMVLVKAIKPDVAVLHVQRSDAEGNAHCWGNLGVCEEGGLASGSVILVTEEIVPHRVIVSDPNRVLLPASKVVAVVHEPWGAHPSPVQGRYGRDHAFYDDYHARSRTPEGFEEWTSDWVFNSGGRAGYLSRLGRQRQDGLRPARQLLAAPVDYGY